jgi:gluconolactonase
MKVDRMGNIYCTGAGGISIIDPSGKVLGRIIPPEAPANLAWGGEGWSTLFITARTSVYRLHTLATGIPVPISP